MFTRISNAIQISNVYLLYPFCWIFVWDVLRASVRYAYGCIFVLHPFSVLSAWWENDTLGWCVKRRVQLWDDDKNHLVAERALPYKRYLWDIFILFYFIIYTYLVSTILNEKELYRVWVRRKIYFTGFFLLLSSIYLRNTQMFT